MDEAAVVATSYSNGTPVAICDLCTVTSVLDVRTHGRVFDVNALIDITHGYNNDITMSLSHGGTTVLLANRLGGSEGRNYSNTVFDDQAGVAIDAGWAYAPYTGSYLPQQALAAFIDAEPAAEVPEPGSLALFGAALAGFAGVARKRKRKRKRKLTAA